jgi:ferredoxin
LKPCDTYSFNQLVKEHRIVRDNVYVVGIECYGKLDIEKIKARGIDGIVGVQVADGTLTVNTIYGSQTLNMWDAVPERCANCKSKKHVAYDELIGSDGEVETTDRFDMVAKLEAMTPDERFEFWRGELSRCIRCNACRNVCPACSCEKCVFDNDDLGTANKAPVTSFEENMFHIIRAFHVAGRCTDCGECSRVCPQNIPLHLLNRKFIKDINELYGDFQAGDDTETRAPLTNFRMDDCEPNVVYERGGNK